MICVVDCRYKLQADRSSFSSPTIPLTTSYPDFQVCSWAITVSDTSQGISLSFQTLNVPNCKKNHLDIYDGSGNNGSTLLARLCGKNATSRTSVVSTMNKLYIVLKSGDNRVRNREDSSNKFGFYAEYEAIKIGIVNIICFD